MNWEAKYAGGHAQRYPWDAVVSFLYRYGRFGDRVLEVGCGTGANLWFAAREGFSVAGIDISQSAINYATKRFASEGLPGDLIVGDIRDLPWPDASFDIVIDRAAISCLEDAVTAVSEVRRVLRVDGVFLFTPYSRPLAGYARAYSRSDIEALLDGWSIERFQHTEVTDEYAQWRVIARKH